MFGQGLLKGMAITFRHFFGRGNTVQYPEKRIPMTDRFRGGLLVLDLGKCIACSMCAMTCPNQVISLTTETGEDKKKRLTSYCYCTGLCLFCNLCVEVCPTKAITWSRDYELATYRRDGLSFDCFAAAKVVEGRRQSG